MRLENNIVYKRDFFYDHKRNSLILSKNYFNKTKFRKITGSTVGILLENSEYVTPLQQWMIITKLLKKGFVTFYSKANDLEPIIRDFISQERKVRFKSYKPAEIGYDVFPKDPVFGGIPDGEPVDSDGNVSYKQGHPMLEIKTASFDTFLFDDWEYEKRLRFDHNGLPVVKKKNGGYEKWFGNDGSFCIPKTYINQLQLYLYLRNTIKGLFVVVFLEVEDYMKDYDDAEVKKLFCKKLESQRNRLFQKEINVDLSQLSKQFKSLREWYHDYVHTGISPAINKADKSFLRYLGVNDL